MDLKQQRAAAIKAAQDIIAKAKSDERDLTSDEVAQVEERETEIKGLTEKIEAQEKSDALVARLSAFSVKEPEPQANSVKDDRKVDPSELGIGERFVKSDGMQALRKQYGSTALRDTKNPIHVEAKALGGLDDLGIGAKATITTFTGQASPQRLPGYRSTLLDEPSAFLSLITTGNTDSSWLEYAQIVSETDNAAIVPEGELKPLSDLATAKAEAKAHVYADGFDVTNQTLADDGALAAFMQARIVQHVRNKVEDVVINGDATANVKGILTTTGVQSQAFDTDVLTTLARALAKVEAVQVDPQAIVMNPADVWALKLLKDGEGRFYAGGPFSGSVGGPWGVSLVSSNRVTAGSALVGNFSSFQLLEREPLSVVAFNQHKDYAQRNMSYVRAELRAMQLFYAPREVVVADLTA